MLTLVPHIAAEDFPLRDFFKAEDIGGHGAESNDCGGQRIYRGGGWAEDIRRLWRMKELWKGGWVWSFEDLGVFGYKERLICCIGFCFFFFDT